MQKISLILVSLLVSLNCVVTANAGEAKIQSKLLKTSVKGITVSLANAQTTEEQAALMLLRGVTESELGQNGKAAKDISKALQLDPSLSAQIEDETK